MKFTINNLAHVNRIMSGGKDAAGKWRQLTDEEERLMRWLQRHTWIAGFLKEIVDKDGQYGSQVKAITYNEHRSELIITERQMGAEMKIRFHGFPTEGMIKTAAWHSYGDIKTAMFHKVFSGVMAVFAKHHIAFHADSLFKELGLSDVMRSIYPSQRPVGGHLVLLATSGPVTVSM